MQVSSVPHYSVNNPKGFIMNSDYNFRELYDYAVSIDCDACINDMMSQYTSFKTGGPCGVRLSPSGTEQLIAILKKAKELSIPYEIIGKGTNILVPDEGIDKAVIVYSSLNPSCENLGDGYISFSADTSLTALCRFAYSESLGGLEFAFGIPGSCGGAIYMNAGAYGGEMKDVLTEITHLTPDFKIETIKAEDAKLSYRHSIYKENGCIILGGKIKLTPDSQESIKAKMDDFLGRRKDKQPLEYPSAGSTFKRPEGYFAGALIEQCSLKGKSVGGAQVSEKHAGFVINKSNATSTDILDLIDLVRDTVQNETGVTLEPEVIVLR